MVDLSKTEDRPVETSTSGPLDLEMDEQTSNGRKPAVDADDVTTLSDYTGASIRVLEGIEAVRLRPGNVHRRHTPRRAASSGLRSRRQLDRRGDGRLLPATFMSRSIPMGQSRLLTTDEEFRSISTPTVARVPWKWF